MKQTLREERKRIVKVPKLELVRMLLATGVADDAVIHISEGVNAELGAHITFVVIEKVGAE